MAKEIYYGKEARERILSGAKKLYDAVKVTYGPRGENVIIGKKYGTPIVTHDGVTVANAIELNETDPKEYGYKVGADLIKTATKNLNKVAGDGTTSVTILTYAILKEANKLIDSGHNSQEIKRGLHDALTEVLANLDKNSKQITVDSPKLAELASISSGSKEIGQVIADVFKAIGTDGAVTVESGQSLETLSIITEGYSLDRGYASPYFVNDSTKQEAVYKNVMFLITDQKITTTNQLAPILENLLKQGRKELVIIADEVSGDALSFLLLNKIQGAFNSVVVKAPAFGDQRKAVMEDLAVLTGAKLITEVSKTRLEDINIDVLGEAKKIIVSQMETIIVSGKGSSLAVKNRVNLIKEQIKSSQSDFEKDQLKKRVASLMGKVATISVGGSSEMDIDERKYRVDDAVSATKVALLDGVTIGGGVALLNASKDITIDGVSSYNAGKQILKESLKQPFKQLVNNSGLNAEALIDKVENAKSGYGVNVATGELVDLYKEGIIDPLKVLKEVVKNSVSIASNAMTMGALVIDLPEEKDLPLNNGL